MVAAAAIRGKHPARTWDEEIRDLSASAAQLSATSREAICGVLDSVMSEGCLDRQQAQAADELRMALSRRVLEHAA